MRDVEATAGAFHRACVASGVGYAFVGGIAVLAWGQPRATADVDALVDLPADRVARLVEKLAGEGLVADRRALSAALTSGGHATVEDTLGAFHVDVKVARTDEEVAEVGRAVSVAVAGHELRIASPEDTVAFKLLFGSPQDLADARSILVRQAKRMDASRLRDVARALRVEARLDAALAEAGSDGPLPP